MLAGSYRYHTIKQPWSAGCTTVNNLTVNNIHNYNAILAPTWRVWLDTELQFDRM